MTSIRKIISIGILLAGVAGFLLIVRSGGQPHDDVPRDVLVLNDAADSRFDFSKQAAQLPAALPRLPDDSLAASDNVTDRAVAAYGQTLVELNQDRVDDIRAGSPLFIPETEVFDRAISPHVAGEFEIMLFELEDVRAVASNKDSFEAYRAAIQEAYSVDADGLEGSYLTALIDAFTLEEFGLLRQHIDLLSRQVDGFLAIPVPSNLHAFHVELLNILQRQMAIGEAVLDMNSDPLKAFLALKRLEDVVSAEQQLLAALDSFHIDSNE